MVKMKMVKAQAAAARRESAVMIAVIAALSLVFTIGSSMVMGS